jgi:NADH pyrophosphatase NudC (nudix superfamily)
MAEYVFCPLCGTRLERAQIDNRDRMKCPGEGCGFVFWDNPLPVVAAIIEHDGLVLIARNKLWPEKMFGLVTGFLEKGESPASAVLREVKEETGLDGKIVSLVGVYPFFQRNEVISVYHVRTSGEVKLGEELAEFKLLPPEKVRPWPFGTGPALADWLDARPGKTSK